MTLPFVLAYHTCRSARGYRPKCSPGLGIRARTRTRTSPSPISGLSMFPSSGTSGEPYSYRTIAFMGGFAVRSSLLRL